MNSPDTLTANETRAAPLPPANDPARLTATEYLAALASGKLGLVEYARACADQVERAESMVGAWAWYERERFLEAAAKAAAELATRAGSVLPAAAGVPLAVKDVFNTIDMPTNHGSPIFNDYTPGNDARVVTSVRRAGGLVMGKTVTAELAVHTPGKTRNPLDLARSCGTSSSGSAAAVAACMAPWALGTQTAGSTIRPASYCGIYAFKPSFGLLPRTAMLKTTDTLDSVGMMTRSVADLALMFEIMRVRGPNYPVVDREMSNPVRLGKSPGPWRVGVVRGPKSDLESPAVKRGMERIVSCLSAAGCHIEPIALPADFDHAHDAHETIYRRALAYYFKLEWAKSRDQFSDTLAAMIEGGLAIPVEAYHEATREQSRLAALMDDLLKRVDVVIAPSTADEAPIGLDSPDIDDHNLIWTMCHLPSMTLPLLEGSTGLPVGVQIAARRFDDYIALSFADYLDKLMKATA